jgi:hypothetical protein
MNLRQSSRAVLAVLAAYAVALQAVMLAAVVPGGPGGQAGAGDWVVLCAHSGGGDSVPVGHGCDCLCLAGGCTAAAAPLPRIAVIAAPALVPAVVVSVEAAPLFRHSATGAHRSRAPPLG